MALQSSGQISMSDIVAEKGATAGSSADNISLHGLSVDGVSDYRAVSSSLMIDTAGSPNQVAPYQMSEFYSWAMEMPYNSLTRGGADNVGSFVRTLNSYNGFGALAISYQIVHMSINMGSGIYYSVFYLEETANGLGSYKAAGSSSTAMTTGALYPIFTASFDSADWPDSYQIDISHSESFGGGGAYSATQTEMAGTGETYTSGANWDNSVFTLLSPSGTQRTAFKELHSITGECWTGVYQGVDTITFKYNRSGYPQLVIPSFTIDVEADFNHVGMCP